MTVYFMLLWMASHERVVEIRPVDSYARCTLDGSDPKEHGYFLGPREWMTVKIPWGARIRCDRAVMMSVREVR